ncbi:MAG: HEAT repeat domain-containing protein, partial [Phycisphaerae bacterium]|nr:HEAT repeat domain-containing protein [Phycisphaerae bacterium]
AALLTIGRLADFENGRLSKPFTAKVRQIAQEQAGGGADAKPRNEYLHLAASYALCKLTGDPQGVLFMADLLAKRKSASGEEKSLAKLRAETVYILSLIPSLKPRPLLQVALADPDIGVQVAAQNRLAVLGDDKALDAVVNMAQSPVADEQLDALDTMGQVKLENLDALRACFDTARHREVQMAAARALGMHGDPRGQKLALSWLNYKDRDRLSPADLEKDPLHEYRVRFLAALALGAIGNYNQSAGPLLEVIQGSPSRRFQVTAARAGLELLRRSNTWPATGIQ